MVQDLAVSFGTTASKTVGGQRKKTSTGTKTKILAAQKIVQLQTKSQYTKEVFYQRK